MSVAVCHGPAAMPAFQPSSWLQRTAEIENTYINNKPAEVVAADGDDRPAQVDIWNAIQADVVDKVATGAGAKKPYVHPLMRRSSSSLMSQKSLEICTESLCSETGSGDFTASVDDLFGTPAAKAATASEESFWRRGGWEQDEEEEEEEEAWERKELVAVNYHCSGWTRTRSPSSPPRSFPPPLPSMSSRDAPCVQMRPRRQDGRLIVDAVVVRPRGYLHATRHSGRLRLSFVESSARDDQTAVATVAAVAAATTDAPSSFFPIVDAKRDEEEHEEVATEVVDDEEEEVEVVDRGTVVEVKVSTQPQTPTAAKVHRSTLVINKFVGSTPLSVVEHPTRLNANAAADATPDDATVPPPAPGLRRVPSSTSTTTLAAAVAVASTSTDGDGDDDGEPHTPCGGASLAAADTKQLLLFTSRCRDKQELLQSVRQCRQLRQKPLFILEPYCIATS